MRAGLLITDDQLRLVYAPKGETSGWLSFPLRALATVAGQPMLGGFKLALNAFRLHNDTEERRLPGLPKQSRDAQAEVSEKLAGQVLRLVDEGRRSATPPPTASRPSPSHPASRPIPGLRPRGRPTTATGQGSWSPATRGMTKTYNRFHDPRETAADIVALRELHAAMDRAVLEAYGWGDLAARAEPIFLDESNEDDHT